MKRILYFLFIALVLCAGCKKHKQNEQEQETKPTAPPDVVAVDLGLSVLWADRNIGAATPQDPGDSFAWGESKTREAGAFAYDYVFNDIEPPVTLTPEYDTATQLWGDDWRMPTTAEIKELFALAKEQVKEGDKIVGMTVSDGKGNSIYFPDDPNDTVLSMRLWTSERSENDAVWAYCVDWPMNGSISNSRREYSHHVRAVKRK